MAHIRQSRQDSGLGFQVKVLKLFKVVPSSRIEAAFSLAPSKYGQSRFQSLPSEEGGALGFNESVR